MATITKEEFEKYLESIGGLVNGYFTDREPIKTRGSFSVQDGWLGLIKDLITELLSIGWEKHIYQVKEKFGGLRFYAATTSEGYDIINKYEDLSWRICEVCGEKGELRGGAWMSTLCEEHYKI